VGIIFKGKGFYVTDNRSKAKSSTAIPTTRETKSEKPGKSETKKESKSTSTSED
jgi:hypothetical protein